MKTGMPLKDERVPDMDGIDNLHHFTVKEILPPTVMDSGMGSEPRLPGIV